MRTGHLGPVKDGTEDLLVVGYELQGEKRQHKGQDFWTGQVGGISKRGCCGEAGVRG